MTGLSQESTGDPGRDDDPESGMRTGGHSHGQAGGHSHGHGHSHGSRLTLTGEHRRSLITVRLISPTAVRSPLLIAFGLVALTANAVNLLVLRRGQSESLNIRGAFLEVASDALGAAAVIVTGIVIAATGFTRADPIASLLVGVLILPRTWRLLADALDVLLEASPRGVDLSEVRRHLTALTGVQDVHDLHAWTITSGLPVISVHIVVEPGVLADGRSAVMLDTLQGCLRGHFDVDHSTFQLELAGHADHERPMHQ